MNQSRKNAIKRILYTLMIVTIFKIGTLIPVPFINLRETKLFGDYVFFDIFNLSGGGIIQSFSIFALGITPFITSSIIIQLLTNNEFRYFERLGKAGEKGQEKITQITRYISLFFAFGSSLAISTGLNAFVGHNLIKGDDNVNIFFISLLLTIGSLILTWFADLINQFGIGNGTTVIIASGILFNLPMNVLQLINSIENNKQKTLTTILTIVVSVLMIGITIAFQRAIDKKLKIQFTRVKEYDEESYLPLKINSSSVVPIILSGTILSIPALVNDLVHKIHPDMVKWTWIKLFDTQQPDGMIIYVVMTILFTFIYSLSQVRPHKIVYSLNQSSAYIFDTDFDLESEYTIIKRVNVLSAIASLFLSLSIVVPFVLTRCYQLPAFLTFGGTSLIILVNVIDDISKQLRGILFNYDFKI